MPTPEVDTAPLGSNSSAGSRDVLIGAAAGTDVGEALRHNVSVRIQILAATMAGTWVMVMAINMLRILVLGEDTYAQFASVRSPETTMAIGWTIFGLVLLASALAFWAARRSRASVEHLSDFGLFYGIVCTLLIAMVENQLPLVDQPTRGVSSTLGWIMFFPLLMHARPRAAITAALLSAAMTPLAMVFWSWFGVPLPDGPAFLGWCSPPLISAGIAIIPIMVMHRMVMRVRDAQKTVEQLGSYHLEERIGSGGMGDVWRARHALLARPAAVKIIRPETLGQDAASVETALGRFEREAQATADLESPHTVSLFDFGKTADGRIYYAMELLDGVDLESLVERYGPLEPARVVHVLAQVCRSLDEAHARELVHRDIKPANIVLCRYARQVDFAKVLDFGLVKKHTAFDSGNATLTKTGTISGTPAYLAPEIITGDHPADGRADLYALGCVAWWLLTGRRVFSGDVPIQVMLKHAKDDPDASALRSEHELPETLKALVLECLAKDPADRPADAATLLARLEAVVLSEPWSRSRAERWWDVHEPTRA